MNAHLSNVSALVDTLTGALRRAHGLPESDNRSIQVLIEAGEWEVALEALCTQIDEYGVSLADSDRSTLVQLGEDLGVDVLRLLD